VKLHIAKRLTAFVLCVLLLPGVGLASAREVTLQEVYAENIGSKAIWTQGGAVTEEGILYYCYRDRTDARVWLYKRRLCDGALLVQRETTELLGHANDMTWNPVTRQILIPIWGNSTTGGGNPGVAVLDENLNDLYTFNGPHALAGIAVYDAAQRIYVGTVGGSVISFFQDPNVEGGAWFARSTYYRTPIDTHTHQGCSYYKGYVYDIESPDDDVGTNLFLAYKCNAPAVDAQGRITAVSLDSNYRSTAGTFNFCTMLEAPHSEWLGGLVESEFLCHTSDGRVYYGAEEKSPLCRMHVYEVTNTLEPDLPAPSLPGFGEGWLGQMLEYLWRVFRWVLNWLNFALAQP
jgi:hypothetical protein